MAFLHFFDGIRCSTCGGATRFDLLHASPAVQQRLLKNDRGVRPWDASNEDFSGLFICSTCRAPSLLQFRFRKDASQRMPMNYSRDAFLNRLVALPSAPNSPSGMLVKTGDYGVDLGWFADVVTGYPSVVVEAPKDLPPHIERMWLEDLANVLKSPRSTVNICRSILELICKDKGATNGGINGKIGALVKDGILTKEIGDWAHTVRQLGNEAVHDPDPVDPKDATEVYEFTRVIAEILYSYPARIERLRRKPEG